MLLGFEALVRSTFSGSGVGASLAEGGVRGGSGSPAALDNLIFCVLSMMY
jgi:hypothetical protein